MPPAASALWKSTSVERWEHLRAQHADLQRRAGVASRDASKLARLAELDADFVTSALPLKLHDDKASLPLLTKSDLVKAVEWKLLRGKWRPSLLKYAQEQTDAAVGAAAAAALAALGDRRRPSDAQVHAALAALCALRGVGPATASIFLCAATAGRIPYMADEALEACLGTRKYTADELVALAGRLGAKAAALAAAAAAAGAGGRAWAAEDVQRALHAAELESRLLGGGVAGASKKKAAAAAAPAASPKRQRRR
jgi:hypothetical protein